MFITLMHAESHW